jgi:hypothetical protein
MTRPAATSTQPHDRDGCRVHAKPRQIVQRRAVQAARTGYRTTVRWAGWLVLHRVPTSAATVPFMALVGVVVRTKAACPVIYACSSSDDDEPSTWSFKASRGFTPVEQQYQLSTAFKTYLAALKDGVSILVLREADDGLLGRDTTTRKTRFRCEGAIVTLAREESEQVFIFNGQQTASTCREDLKELEARMSKLVTTDFTPAASALQAARSIARDAP